MARHRLGDFQRQAAQGVRRGPTASGDQRRHLPAGQQGQRVRSRDRRQHEVLALDTPMGPGGWGLAVGTRLHLGDPVPGPASSGAALESVAVVDVAVTEAASVAANGEAVS